MITLCSKYLLLQFLTGNHQKSVCQDNFSLVDHTNHDQKNSCLRNSANPDLGKFDFIFDNEQTKFCMFMALRFSFLPCLTHVKRQTVIFQVRSILCYSLNMSSVQFLHSVYLIKVFPIALFLVTSSSSYKIDITLHTL